MQRFLEQFNNRLIKKFFYKSRMDCPFCKIVNGEIPSKKVYEDNNFFAALDISPAEPGHIVLMTKQHVRGFSEFPIPLCEDLARVVKNLSKAAIQATDAQGTMILVKEGPNAGQQIDHFVIHIIPRQSQDSVVLKLNPQEFSPQDLNDVKTVMIGGIKKVIEG